MNRGLALLSCLALVACGGAPVATDTGYAGSWVRGAETRSFIYIVPDGNGGYRFRLGMEDDDGVGELRCDWDGRCTRFVNRDPIAEFRFRPRVDDETGELLVEYDVIPTDGPPMHYVDRFEVLPGGLSLEVRTIERNGETFRASSVGRRVFRKLSDTVPGAP